MSDVFNGRRFAPATERNRSPILAVLEQQLPPTGTVLEISSGTGEHAVFFAPHLAPRHWLTSDPDPGARQSIAAWCNVAPADNLHGPIALDASTQPWPVETLAAQSTQGAQLQTPAIQTAKPGADPLATLDLKRHPITALVNINMIHIAPWSACLGLMAGAGRLLPPNGILYLYGPFKQSGQHNAPSNAAFDRQLRAQNVEWGVRDLEAVVAAAEAQGLALVTTVAMPANNFSVVFRAL
jgi:hypothetical protein